MKKDLVLNDLQSAENAIMKWAFLLEQKF